MPGLRIYASPVLAPANSSPTVSCHMAFYGQHTYGRSRARPMAARQTPQISLKSPLLSRDPEQRKSLAGIPPFRAPQVVQARTESGGSPAKAPRLEGWSEAATLCNLVWVSTQSVVHWWCQFGANAEQKSPPPCSLRGRQDVTKSLF
jgi:hypothetical protein